MSDRKPTITPEWRVPLYVVGSAVGLAVLMTAQWFNLKSEVRDLSANALSVQQAQEWIDNAREQNQTTPVKWPRIPDKKPLSALDSMAVVAARDDQRLAGKQN